MPAEVTENPDLRAALAAPPGGADSHAPDTYLAWGAEFQSRGPSHALLRRAGGNHLMIVGPRDDAALLDSQYCSGFALLPVSQRRHRTDYLSGRDLARQLRKPASQAGHRGPPRARLSTSAPQTSHHCYPIWNLNSSFAPRRERMASPPVFFLINNLQKFKQLRYEDDFSFSMDDDQNHWRQARKPARQHLLRGRWTRYPYPLQLRYLRQSRSLPSHGRPSRNVNSASFSR